MAALVLCSLGNVHAQSSVTNYWVGTMDYGSVKIPFSFELENSASETKIILINGEERVVLYTSEKLGDSLLIPLRPFDAFLKLKILPDFIAGTWEKPYRNLLVNFTAKPGSNRIPVSIEPGTSVDNKWSMTLKPNTPDAYQAIALLNQSGNKVMGTVMTEVGDFRYFEGVVNGDSIKMSSFDGSHAFYLVGRKQENNWSGEFYFDPEYSEKWIAIPDDQVELRDPFDLVQISGDKLTPYFDIMAAGTGRHVIDPSAYEGKVLVIQLFGTWCPNSLDETNFLLEWYPTRPKGVEVLAIDFEPIVTKEYGEMRISEYKDFLDIPYDIFFGGRMNKQQAAIAFPFMSKIEAFPTLVILDKQGNARFVHSYFNGPATGEYYQVFKDQFNERIELLLKE